MTHEPSNCKARRESLAPPLPSSSPLLSPSLPFSLLDADKTSTSASSPSALAMHLPVTCSLSLGRGRWRWAYSSCLSGRVRACVRCASVEKVDIRIMGVKCAPYARAHTHTWTGFISSSAGAGFEQGL